MMKFIRCTAVALMLVPAPGAAQDFDAGFDAYLSGDYATALREWRPLAEQGDARAQVQIGRMYATGRGVVQDFAETLRWYRTAAEQGDARAQVQIGFMYDIGLGVAQDDAEAARWYRLAAEQGDATAQYYLGLMYDFGGGVVQDYVTAHMWLNIAAANGNEDARERRDIVANLMTADAIAEAQRRARTCMASEYQDCD